MKIDKDKGAFVGVMYPARGHCKIYMLPVLEPDMVTSAAQAARDGKLAGFGPPMDLPSGPQAKLAEIGGLIMRVSIDNLPTLGVALAQLIPALMEYAPAQHVVLMATSKDGDPDHFALGIGIIEGCKTARDARDNFANSRQVRELNEANAHKAGHNEATRVFQIYERGGVVET